MIQPNELKLVLPMRIANDVMSTTTQVWEILRLSHDGELEKIKTLLATCPSLIYAQYNYTPPIHFAVREGHTALVKYLLDNGAHDPSYRFYPFLDRLQTVANDRGWYAIEDLLDAYEAEPDRHQFKGDNGEIIYNRTEQGKQFEKAVDHDDLATTAQLLKLHPEFAKDETFFWGEGILMRPAKENRRAMIDLLLRYGAKVPDILKWAQFYYFERLDAATYLMEKGMNPNTMSWQRVTILHDMAQKGFLDKAGLLIKYGADINVIDEAYQSTPLGMAARWGHADMVKYLIKHGADVNKAGAPWATPLAWAKKKGYPEIEEILINNKGKN